MRPNSGNNSLILIRDYAYDVLKKGLKALVTCYKTV